MGIVKKEAKEEIIKLMLQECTAEEIAQRLNYSVSTIRKVFEELREDFGASSKVGIATAYLRNEFTWLNEKLQHILKIMDSGQIATGARTCTRLPKSRNKR